MSIVDMTSDLCGLTSGRGLESSAPVARVNRPLEECRLSCDLTSDLS